MLRLLPLSAWMPRRLFQLRYGYGNPSGTTARRRQKPDLRSHRRCEQSKLETQFSSTNLLDVFPFLANWHNGQIGPRARLSRTVIKTNRAATANPLQSPGVLRK